MIVTRPENGWRSRGDLIGFVVDRTVVVPEVPTHIIVREGRRLNAPYLMSMDDWDIPEIWLR